MKIFMIGTQRSGSNLLRLMMNQLSDVAAPHPPHILERMMPLVNKYGDLSVEANFDLMVDDVCRLIELNPEPWEGVILDRADIKKRCVERSLPAIFGATYDVMADVNHKNSWCCKSLANISYLDDLERCYGNDAMYLYLYRDGRDVALSFKKAVVGEKHIYNIAKEWGDTQRLALTSRNKIPNDRFYSMSYEELTSDAEKSTRGLCDFLKVEFSPSMLEAEKSKDAQSIAQKSGLWANVAKPLMKNNTNKFLKELTPEDIKIFELVAGDVLDILGYERFQTQVGESKVFSPEEIDQFNLENDKLKKEMAEKLKETDPEDLKRRELQASLIKEIKAR